MSDMPPESGFPFEGDPEMFKDAPLFRELQRVMASSAGPINWELARQVGIANAVEAGDDRAPTQEDLQGFEDAVRVAELQVARFTGLEPPNDVAQVRAIRRAEWVTANAESLRALLEPAAARISEAMLGATREQLPPEAQAMGAFMSQLSPLLMGTQVGTVLGFLAQHVLGQYDVAVPRSGSASVLFVVPNIAAFEQDWSLDRTDFRTWVALHEITHRFEFAQLWTATHLRDLLDDYLSTLQFDIEGMQSRLQSLDAADPDSLQALMASDEGLFGTTLDDEQRLKLARIQSFMAATEGYADHVMHQLGREWLPSYARIEEAVSRLDTSNPDPVFSRLLGVDVGPDHYRAGRAFCDTVVELTDEVTLSRMWESAEAMPSLPEVHEPRLWLARTV